MESRVLTKDNIESFKNFLIKEEKSELTVEKYLSDIKAFLMFINGKNVSKEMMLEYKQFLISKYAARSVNSKIASLNSLFAFMGWNDCKVRSLKLQRQIFITEEKELTKAEYCRLLNAAKTNVRLYLILQAICSTGIRVSELQFFTVEAIKAGMITASCKNKTRNIFIPSKLKKMLLNYAKKKGIIDGVIFRTRSGKPLNRSNIWSEMKHLCKIANVNPSKVFPHNLRKLFARTFYGLEKDIAKLADILGHSSIDTTRIYIMTTGVEHKRKIECLGLIC